MNRLAQAALATALGFLAGCSLFRWSGYPDSAAPPQGRFSAVELELSTVPARAPAPELPPTEDLPRTLYYADLGPDTIDVEDYPAQQKFNYGFFRLQCARCHTLARAVNSPAQSRAYWHFHLVRMSLHSRLQREGPIPPDQVKAVLDFLEYDARVRKIDDRKRFEARTEELKRRFEPTLKRLLEHMQTSPQPRLIHGGASEEP
ncbi:MAG: hypothetical protein NDJ72_08810 [Elusimicrobia bacterium]|nr:hypothetical protein [Elusimicrobiota bacterium]